jgi:signal transduction histidine kinase
MAALGVVMLVANPYGFALPPTMPGRTVVSVAGEPVYWLQFAVAGQLLLSYPTGRLARGSAERRLVLACYLLVGAITVATLVTRLRPASEWGVDGAVRSGGAVLWVLLSLVAVALLVRRLTRSTPLRRRGDSFALLASGSALLLFAALFLVTLTGGGNPEGPGTSGALHTTMAWTGVIAVPVAYSLGLLRDRLAFASVADLARRLEHVGADRVEEVLGEVLRDPGLRVTFPTAGGPLCAATAHGDLAAAGGQLRTVLGDPPVAVLLHDRALSDDRPLLDAAAAAARLALDNARLHAELRAQLADVQASRRRIALASAGARRRFEQDVRHGVEHRLLGMVDALGALHARFGGAAAGLIVEIDIAVRAALDDLHDLAQGLHPAVLTDEGLAAAVCELAGRADAPISTDVRLPDRLDPMIEATAYYIVSEALQNVVKHAPGAAVRVTVRVDDQLMVSVVDDGPGGAATGAGAGTGLRGLQDRVEAIGGRLVIDSPPGAGTVVAALLPVAPAAATSWFSAMDSGAPMAPA